MKKVKLRLKTLPDAEAVDLADVKAQLRIDEDDTSYDAQLNILLPAARQWCENYQNRAYITQTWELALDKWPCERYIRLPRPPLIEVVSVTVTDDEGSESPFLDYTLDTYSEPARIIGEWPKGRLADTNGIVIEYTAGYGSNASDVPENIRQAIILLTVHWFENGQCDPPPAVKWLLGQDRVVPV